MLRAGPVDYGAAGTDPMDWRGKPEGNRGGACGCAVFAARHADLTLGPGRAVLVLIVMISGIHRFCIGEPQGVLERRDDMQISVNNARLQCAAFGVVFSRGSNRQ
jgi:hypothetical protein